MRRISRAVVTLIWLSSLVASGFGQWPAQASAQSTSEETLGVKLHAAFDHNGALQTDLRFALPVTYAEDEQTASLTIGLSQGCFGLAHWISPNEGATLGPVALCLAGVAATANDLRRAGIPGEEALGKAEFSLSFQRKPGEVPGQAATFVQSADAKAQLFYLACNDGSAHALGTILAPAGASTLQASVGPYGQTQIHLSGEGMKLAIDPAAWKTMSSDCAQPNQPPVEPPPTGQSTIFELTTETGAHPQQGLWGITQNLSSNLEQLHFKGDLGLQDLDTLQRDLDSTEKALRTDSPDKAQHEFAKFSDRLLRLIEQGRLDQANAKPLITQAQAFPELLASFQDPAPVDPSGQSSCGEGPGECPSYQSCDFSDVYVDSHASILGADGSLDHPFPSLTQALKPTEGSGENGEPCGVNLHLAPGAYLTNGDPIEISRHTRLLGPDNPEGLAGSVFLHGGIVNHGPFLLELQRLNLVWNGDGPSQAIVADHPCAHTIVHDTTVTGFAGYGIRQRSGVLELLDSAVRYTATPDEWTYLTQGTGVHVSCGAQAYLVDVDLDGNQSSALQIAGTSTRAVGFDVRVSHTGVHPAYSVPGFAPNASRGRTAVQVRDGATLVLSAFDIHDNQLAGLSAAAGASAIVSNGRIVRTEAFLDAAGDKWGGFGLYSSGGASLTLSNFEIDRSDLCGVTVALTGGMDLWHGVIDHSPVGACVQDPDFAPARLQHDVEYRTVDVPLQAMTYSLPGAIGPPVDP